jgi:hypothetical protein
VALFGEIFLDFNEKFREEARVPGSVTLRDQGGSMLRTPGFGTSGRAKV